MMSPVSVARLRPTGAAFWLLVVLVPVLALTAEAQDPEYRISPQDVLKIRVLGEEDLTQTVVVGPDGTFPFPLLGQVRAAGLTPNQVAGQLRELLEKDYLVDPQITVKVEEYRSQRVLVLGEVEKTGTYVLPGGQAMLLDILVQAGGPSKNAGRQVTVVRPARLASATDASVPATPGSTTLRVPLKALLEGDPTANIPLQNGDTVYISPLTSVFVLGEIRSPGAYGLERATTALEAITLAGGFTDRAAPAGAKILRKHLDGTEETIPVDLSVSGANPRARDGVLKDGDIVLVPVGSTIFVLGEVKRPGAYILDRPMPAPDAITLAGGFSEKGAQTQVKLIRRSPSGEERTVVLDLSGADPRAREVAIEGGDTLLVAAGNSFFVLGEVKSPGGYLLEPGTTAIQGIARAGGLTDRAAPNRTKIIRTHKDGRQENLIVDLNDVLKRGRKDKDVLLAPNDVIVVPESWF